MGQFPISPISNFKALAVKKISVTISKEKSIWLICTGIAFVFWVAVKLSKPYETKRSVNLNYTLPVGKVFANVPPNSLEATYTGSGWDLLTKLSFRRLPSLNFNLSEWPENIIERNDLVRRIEDISKLAVLDVDRGYISLELDTAATRKVPIVLNKAIQFEEDYFQKDSIHCFPDSAVISGPAALLRTIDRVMTLKSTFGRVRSDLHFSVPLQDPAQGQVTISPQEVKVTIPVEQFTEKTFTIPVQVVSDRDSVLVFPPEVRVTCVVGLSRYDKIKAEDFIVEVDLSGGISLPGQNTAPLQFRKSPEWLRSVTIFPKAVEFFFIQ